MPRAIPLPETPAGTGCHPQAAGQARWLPLPRGGRRCSLEFGPPRDAGKVPRPPVLTREKTAPLPSWNALPRFGPRSRASRPGIRSHLCPDWLVTFSRYMHSPAPGPSSVKRGP